MRDDLQAIKNLIFPYPEFFDAGDFDRAVGLFAQATVTVAGSGVMLRGPSARSLLTDMVQLYDGLPSTRHIVSNVIVEIEGRSASVRSYYVALQARPDFPLQPILAGRWYDTVSKADGRWRFASRVIHNDLMGDLGHHLAIPR